MKKLFKRLKEKFRDWLVQKLLKLANPKESHYHTYIDDEKIS